MRFDKRDKVVKVPDGPASPLYRLTKKVVNAMKMKESLVGTKEEVLAKAAKMNAKNRHFSMPTGSKAHYTDHLIQGQYHCLEINIEKKRQRNSEGRKYRRQCQKVRIDIKNKIEKILTEW